MPGERGNETFVKGRDCASGLFKWSARENDGEFRNEVCSVRYDNKEELAQPPLFGAMFHFTLDSQVNCPEFLAYFPLVEHLLEELDMELVFVRRFPEALQHWRTNGMGLLSRMQALEPYPARNGAKLSADESEYEVAKELLKSLDGNESPHIGTLSKSEWEAFCMYLLFAFRKKGGRKCENSPKHPTPPRSSDTSQEKADNDKEAVAS
ncbi:mRNA cap guanine-N7 methyltransferase [Trichostrongylus colubriformis]|uniref:mRNA (guanine-N(7))-methyltransferase n=1 Tax=Trichostrongylus colubriformis TaxID=6319 RepID=A0AAN8IHC6_TRICO